MDVSDYRSDYAAYCSAVELAHYRLRAGLERELNLEPIYDRYGDLFARDKIDGLARALEETPAHRETERVGLRLLAGAARIAYLDAQARELTDELARCSSSSLIPWGGESLPSNNVPKLIANEREAGRRRELSSRWVEAQRPCNDLRAARLDSMHESARSLGYSSYRALYEEVTGVDYARLAADAERFLERTDAAYSAALARAASRDLPDAASDLQHADYLYFQRSPSLEPLFPGRELMETYAAAMRGLGINVDRQKNIDVDDHERPFKNPRAACFRIDPPDDVRLLISPVGGPYDYTVLFHEAGHAQHFGWSSRDLIKRHPEFLYSPDASTTEGYAFLLSQLFLDPVWLTEHRAGLGPERARAVARDLALVVCSSVRRRAGMLGYEVALHDSHDVRSEHLSAAYSDAVSRAMGFRRDPSLHLSDMDDGFYSAAYLRAWAFEASLREYLKTRHGSRWWASRKCGEELIDLWNTASRYTVDELARLVGFGEPSFDLLADNLNAAMSEG